MGTQFAFPRRHHLTASVLESLENRTLLSVVALKEGLTALPGNASVTFGSYTYFAASDAAHGTELWRTNGTRQGTMLVRDINTDPAPSYGSFPSTFMVFNGAVLFVASGDSYGNSYALWRTDGTEAGTVELSRTRSLVGVGYEGWHTFGGKLVGWGENGLIETDGTPEGTKSIPGTAGEALVATTERLYWLAPGGRSVLSYDGHSITTVATAPALTSDAKLTASFANGILYSYRRQSDGQREQVTIAARDLVVRPFQERFANHERHDELSFRGVRYTSDNQNNLWRLGATPLEDILLHRVEPGSLTPSGDMLYFRDGAQLWKTDGTPGGTHLVRDFINEMLQPKQLLGTSSLLYLIVGEGGNTLQPWRSDGTSEGTVKIADVGPTAPPAGSLFGLATHGNAVLVPVVNTLYMITPESAPPPTLSNGALRISGTLNSDRILISRVAEDVLQLEINGTRFPFAFDDVRIIRIYAGDGDDRVISSAAIPTSVMGGAGNDLIKTGDSRDTIYGEDGNDSLYGGGERDWLFGGDGDDRLNGGGGRDIVWGGAGRNVFVSCHMFELRDYTSLEHLLG